MIDYNALRAIDAVIKYQSFEQAAGILGVSQSAISQRIRNLESYVGERLLIRKTPYHATEKGEVYLSLLRKVSALEEDFYIQEKSEDKRSTVKLALNRDSLEFWFDSIFKDKKLAQTIKLEILADDQDMTLSYLKSGQVDLCVSSEKKTPANHLSTYLGKMTYCLVCSYEFHDKYFENGVNAESLKQAPVVLFDEKDDIVQNYLLEHYHINEELEYSLIPSIHGFKKSILVGYGYGLIPLIDIEKELQAKKLVLLNSDVNFEVPLYLHQWEYTPDHIKKLSEKIISLAKDIR